MVVVASTMVCAADVRCGRFACHNGMPFDHDFGSDVVDELRAGERLRGGLLVLVGVVAAAFAAVVLRRATRRRVITHMRMHVVCLQPEPEPEHEAVRSDTTDEGSSEDLEEVMLPTPPILATGAMIKRCSFDQPRMLTAPKGAGGWKR